VLLARERNQLGAGGRLAIETARGADALEDRPQVRQQRRIGVAAREIARAGRHRQRRTQ
jgi:hypothetical protein